jgi:sulfite reductase beta subunit-like hemoprotein
MTQVPESVAARLAAVLRLGSGALTTQANIQFQGIGLAFAEELADPEPN